MVISTAHSGSSITVFVNAVEVAVQLVEQSEAASSGYMKSFIGEATIGNLRDKSAPYQVG